MTKNYKTLFAAVLIAIVSFSFTAQAECDGFYLAGRGGVAKYKVSDHRDNVNNGLANYVIDKKRLMVSEALGYRYGHFRAELEYVWRRKNKETIIGISEARFKSNSYMFVVYWDFFPYSWFTPFVNAGVGYTHSKLNFYNRTVNAGYSAKDDTFTWSLGAGLSAKLTSHWNFDIGYRYYDMGDFSENKGKTEISDQEVYAGFRYVF